MAKTTFSGPVRSKAGFLNIVPNATNPASLQLASLQSTGFQPRTPISFSTSASILYIPAGVFITGIDIYVSTAFNGTTPTVKIGSTVGGSDILGAQSVAATGQTQFLSPAPTAALGALYITVTEGGSTAGAGTIVVHYAY